MEVHGSVEAVVGLEALPLAYERTILSMAKTFYGCKCDLPLDKFYFIVIQ